MDVARFVIEAAVSLFAVFPLLLIFFYLMTDAIGGLFKDKKDE